MAALKSIPDRSRSGQNAHEKRGHAAPFSFSNQAQQSIRIDLVADYFLEAFLAAVVLLAAGFFAVVLLVA